ncbi:uncharacterized protein TNIN_321081 [Trichonephila inaurata madagascariensis]|uniref:Gustatory receptor n=1 Tax=Trichonephila inaurata madagascariensis TaxID=2747483 RepID=A0A8X6YE59_9ARAC|nr:uncharacterized protein TNIN_321081 [Trichonephila inaurata madagascariensis]
MFYQRRNLQVLLCTLEFPKNKQTNKMRRKSILVTKLAFFIACMIPVLMSTVNTFVENGKNIENTFRALKYRPQNDSCGVTVTLMIEYMLFTVYMEYPLLFATCMCAVVHIYELYLLHLNNDLKEKNAINLSAKLSNILNDYNNIEEKIRLLSDTLSTSLFIILLISFCNLFTILAYCLTNVIPRFLLYELCANGFISLIIIYSVTIYCSAIPENMLKIKKTAVKLIDDCVLSELENRKCLTFLERIANKDIIYISAGGVLDFKKSFLLSALGTILTYGLLILNQQRI